MELFVGFSLAFQDVVLHQLLGEQVGLSFLAFQCLAQQCFPSPGSAIFGPNPADDVQLFLLQQARLFF